ncbi:unnamed protein product [Rotaria sp. Silwood1]|nr:unnamed protein product [Rotaria sp. Silwood1]CAF4877912.1 unnamed protein product [Rotaria sp. Silwood1]
MIVSVKNKYPALCKIFGEDMFIREINVHSDPFYGDIVQALKSSFTKLEAIDAYPMIQIQKVQNIKNYSIVIEYNSIITTNSQAEAIAVLIGSYEIFNIEYPPKIQATLEVLNDLSFKKLSLSLSLAAKRFLNEYKLNNGPLR